MSQLCPEPQWHGVHSEHFKISYTYSYDINKYKAVGLPQTTWYDRPFAITATDKCIMNRVGLLN